jgi:uncharacterized protein (TIRG00374 family)
METLERTESINSQKSKRGSFIQIARILFATILVILVFFYVKPKEVVEVLKEVDLWFLIPIIILRPLFYFIRGLKIWQILRIGTGTELPFLRTTGWFFVSCSIGVFTPGGIGDFSLAYFIRRFSIGISQCLAAVFFDKVVNVVVMAVIAIVGCSIYFDFDSMLPFLITLVVLSLVVAVYFGKLGKLRAWDHNKKSNSRVLCGLKLINEFGINHPFAFAFNIVLAFAQSLIVALQIWFSLCMVRSCVDFTGVFWLSGISRLSNLIPLTISGLGIYEASMVHLLKILGAPGANTLAGTLVTRSMTWTLSLLVICWVLLNTSKAKKDSIDVISDTI